MFVDIDRDEGWLMFGRHGRWALLIRWPAVRFYRKRVHPSQREAFGP